MRCSNRLSRLICESSTSKLCVTFLLAIVTDHAGFTNFFQKHLCHLTYHLYDRYCDPLLELYVLHHNYLCLQNYQIVQIVAVVWLKLIVLRLLFEAYLKRYYEATNMSQVTCSQLNSQSPMTVSTSNQMTSHPRT